MTQHGVGQRPPARPGPPGDREVQLARPRGAGGQRAGSWGLTQVHSRMAPPPLPPSHPPLPPTEDCLTPRQHPNIQPPTNTPSVATAIQMTTTRSSGRSTGSKHSVRCCLHARRSGGGLSAPPRLAGRQAEPGRARTPATLQCTCASTGASWQPRFPPQSGFDPGTTPKAPRHPASPLPSSTQGRNEMRGGAETVGPPWPGA